MVRLGSCAVVLCFSGTVQGECVWRHFTDSNQSIINTWTYGIENAFHERLLQANILAPHTSP